MSYSIAEAKLAEVIEAVNVTSEALARIHRDSQRAIGKLDSAIAGALRIEAEIDTNAGSSALWLRLKERKDEIKSDLQAIKTSALAIELAINAELP